MFITHRAYVSLTCHTCFRSEAHPAGGLLGRASARPARRGVRPAAPVLGSGEDTVGNPQGANISQFEASRAIEAALSR